MPSEIEKLVDTLLKKVYAKKRLSKHSKKVKKIRKKKGKNKKKALHSQFKYADALLKHNQKKVGIKPRNVYNQRRRRALQSMHPNQVNRMYNNTQMGGYDPFNDFRNVYREMEHLDWVNQQQEEYDKINAQHQALQRYRNNI